MFDPEASEWKTALNFFNGKTSTIRCNREQRSQKKLFVNLRFKHGSNDFFDNGQLLVLLLNNAEIPSSLAPRPKFNHLLGKLQRNPYDGRLFFDAQDNVEVKKEEDGSFPRVLKFNIIDQSGQIDYSGTYKFEVFLSSVPDEARFRP